MEEDLAAPVDARPSPTPAPRIAYQPGLDGLRGVAVAAVLVFHAALIFDGRLLAKGGYLGVSTFFTLSGFLITTLILNERRSTGGVGLLRFWGRRFRRLMPAAVVTLLLVAVYAAAVATDAAQLSRLRGDLLGALFYVANWRFIASGQSYADLFSVPSPALHFWSLAIEEQFYLFYPLFAAGVLALAHGSRRVFAALVAGLTAASVGLMLVLYHGGTPLARLYYGTDTRAAELLVGALLAVWFTSRYRTLGERGAKVVAVVSTTALAVTVVLYAATPLTSRWLYQGGFFLFALITAAVIAGAVQPRGPVRAFLSITPLRALGLISYGVYLYHWPIFLWLTPERTGLGPWALFPIRLSVTLALATASYYLIEMPIRQRRMIVGRQRWIAVPAALAVVALTAVVVTVDPPDDPLGELRTEIAAAPTLVADSTEQPVRVLVVGDDYAADVARGLQRWAEDSGDLEVSDLSGTPCGSSLADFELEGNSYTTCSGWVDRWTPAIEDFDPDVVLATSATWDVNQLLTAAGVAAPLPDEPRTATWLRQRVAGALTLLGSRGARVLVAEFPHPFTPEGKRDVSDYVLGFADAVDNVVAVDGNADYAARANDLPPYPGPASDAATRHLVDRVAVDQWSATVASQLGPQLLEAGETVRSQRDGTRIMVVGDSVSRSLGDGLESWAADAGDVAVWNTGSNGCGIARGGEPIDVLGTPPDQDVCNTWEDRWAQQLADFDPDLVVVLTGVWDLTDRKLPGSDEVSAVGSPQYDDYLLSEYSDAVDLLSSEGAEVVWLSAPCVGPILPGPLSGNAALDPERTAYLNGTVLPRLADERSDLALVDLFAKACPGGAFDANLGGIPYARPDGLHFAPDSARWVADWLGPLLVARLAVGT